LRNFAGRLGTGCQARRTPHHEHDEKREEGFEKSSHIIRMMRLRRTYRGLTVALEARIMSCDQAAAKLRRAADVADRVRD
jgi:hypothetical protein